MSERKLSLFENYLTLWVFLCIGAGIILGRTAPGFAKFFDGLAIYVGDAPVVSIPIAVCLFLMMYPIMVKIDFAEVMKAGKSVKPVGLTLFINWAEKKIKKMTFWDMALTKFTAMFFGLIIGAYISAFLRHYIWLFVILFIAGYIIAVYRFFIKK